MPPATEILAGTKSIDVSEREKLSVAISPAFKEETSELTVIVGLIVSIAIVTELSASEPSLLMLLDRSEKVKDATEISPSVVLSAAGMKSAEYEKPDPEKLVRMPPE